MALLLAGRIVSEAAWLSFVRGTGRERSGVALFARGANSERSGADPFVRGAVRELHTPDLDAPIRGSTMGSARLLLVNAALERHLSEVLAQLQCRRAAEEVIATFPVARLPSAKDQQQLLEVVKPRVQCLRKPKSKRPSVPPPSGERRRPPDGLARGGDERAHLRYGRSSPPYSMNLARRSRVLREWDADTGPGDADTNDRATLPSSRGLHGRHGKVSTTAPVTESTWYLALLIGVPAKPGIVLVELDVELEGPGERRHRDASDRHARVKVPGLGFDVSRSIAKAGAVVTPHARYPTVFVEHNDDGPPRRPPAIDDLIEGKEPLASGRT